MYTALKGTYENGDLTLEETPPTANNLCGSKFQIL